MLNNTTVYLLETPAIACRVGGGGEGQSAMARVVAIRSPICLFEKLPRRLILLSRISKLLSLHCNPKTVGHVGRFILNVQRNAKSVGHNVQCPVTFIQHLISKMSNVTSEMSNMSFLSDGHNVRCQTKFLVYTVIV